MNQNLYNERFIDKIPHAIVHMDPEFTESQVLNLFIRHMKIYTYNTVAAASSVRWKVCTFMAESNLKTLQWQKI